MAQVGIQLPSTAACIKYCIKPQNCLKLSWLWIIWLIWDLEPTSASYSNIWLPFMWWHLSMRTGPLRRETSRHRSSVLISLSAVYENTWATTKEIKQGCDYYHHTFVKWKSRKPSFSPGFHPCRDSWKSQLSHSLSSPCCPHTGWSLHFWSGGGKATFQPMAKTQIWIHQTLTLTWGEAFLKSLANKVLSDYEKSKWSSNDTRVLPSIAV